jgi:hypothetical protein
MSKATHANITTNRRTALVALATGAATVAACAAVATRIAKGAEATGGLRELEGRFLALYPKWRELNEKNYKLGRASHALAEERAGVPPAEIRETMSRPEASRFVAELDQAEIDTGWRAVSNEYNAVDNAIEEIVAAAMALPTLTGEDFARKVRMSVCRMSSFWFVPYRDLNFEEEIARRLAEDAMRMVGMPFPIIYDEADA